MDIFCTMLAVHAELAPDGKVSILSGDLDTLRLHGDFPFLTIGIPFYLLVKLSFPADECGREYPCRVEMTGPEGQLIEGIDNQLPVPPSTIGRPIKTGFLLAFHHLTFPSLGEYSISILLDGKEIRRLPLRVEGI